jgi:hypothetical protein
VQLEALRALAMQRLVAESGSEWSDYISGLQEMQTAPAGGANVPADAARAP